MSELPLQGGHRLLRRLFSQRLACVRCVYGVCLRAACMVSCQRSKRSGTGRTAHRKIPCTSFATRNLTPAFTLINEEMRPNAPLEAHLDHS